MAYAHDQRLLPPVQAVVALRLRWISTRTSEQLEVQLKALTVDYMERCLQVWHSAYLALSRACEQLLPPMRPDPRSRSRSSSLALRIRPQVQRQRLARVLHLLTIHPHKTVRMLIPTLRQPHLSFPHSQRTLQRDDQKLHPQLSLLAHIPRKLGHIRRVKRSIHLVQHKERRGVEAAVSLTHHTSHVSDATPTCGY